MKPLIIALVMYSSVCGAAGGDIVGYLDPNGVLTLTNASPQGLVTLRIVEDASADAVATQAEAEPVVVGPNLYQSYIEQASRVHAVDPALIHAIVAVESNGRRDAVSRKGAVGLMQIMPATGRRFGVSDLFDPVQNINAGVRYLRALAAIFNNDLALVLAAYNAGENAVMRYGNKIPPYTETQQYVARVIDRYRRLKTTL